MAISLNEQYAPVDRWQAVANHGSGLLVVNAGPGTGKTYSLLRKIERHLAQNVSAESIYYLTFTNSIVTAFRDDVARPAPKGLGKTVATLGINVCTLHSLAFKVLNAYASQLGLPEHLSPYGASANSERVASVIALKDLLGMSRLTRSYPKSDFDSAVEQLQHVWQRGENAPEELRPLAAAFQAEQDIYLSLPWDRAVPLANEAIARFGLPSWLTRATHFMIDEYQDFNPSEQAFIERITQPSDSVVIVGDMDQSIYSGRSASPSGIAALLSRDDVTTVNFVLCRRCPRRILRGANSILQLLDPAGYSSRELQPFKTNDGTLQFEKPMSCKAELEMLTETIARASAEHVRCVLLLFPNKKALAFYRTKLIERGVNAETSTIEDHELRDAFIQLARLGRHPFLERLVLSSYPALERRFGPDVLPRIFRDGKSPSEALAAAAAEAPWRRATRNEHAQFLGAIDTLISKDPEGIATLLTSKGMPTTAETVALWLGQPTESASVEEGAPVPEAELPPEGPPATRIRFVTMHSSKGLSEPVVILPGLEDKWIPGAASAKALEEKHRLFYVALTRAEDELLMTSPKTRSVGDPLNFDPVGTARGPSRYALRVMQS